MCAKRQEEKPGWARTEPGEGNIPMSWERLQVSVATDELSRGELDHAEKGD